MTYTKTEEQIIELLKDGNKRSTSNIVGVLNRNYYFVLNALNEMARSGLLLKIEETMVTYWKIDENNVLMEDLIQEVRQ